MSIRDKLQAFFSVEKGLTATYYNFLAWMMVVLSAKATYTHLIYKYMYRNMYISTPHKIGMLDMFTYIQVQYVFIISNFRVVHESTTVRFSV